MLQPATPLPGPVVGFTQPGVFPSQGPVIPVPAPGGMTPEVPEPMPEASPGVVVDPDGPPLPAVPPVAPPVPFIAAAGSVPSVGSVPQPARVTERLTERQKAA